MVTHRIADEGHQEMMGYPAGEKKTQDRKGKAERGGGG